MLYTKNDILEALKTEIISHNLSAIEIDEVVIDSRKALKNKLFFALKGENNDGHDFLDQAFANGCEAAIIHDEKYFSKSQNLILVKDTFKALYVLAEFARKRTYAKIIAVTGSVGKTGTKEMLKMVFETQGKTHATTGNLNNHYGLPLTLCNIARDTEFAILEMGMNHLNEIEPLSKLAKPHLAVITTIASAHIGNFKSEDEIAVAKSEIFAGLDSNGFVLINNDNKYCDFLKKRASAQGLEEKNILLFGKKEKSDYCLKSIDIKGLNDSEISVLIKNENEIHYKISSAHKATIFNSLIIVACLDLFAKIDGLKALETLSAVKGRGNVFEVAVDNKKITIIDDSYNANAASMCAALEYLSDLKNVLDKKRKIAILGDMFELGDKSDEIHQEVYNFATKNADFLFLAGENFKNTIKTLDNKFKIYLNSNEIASDLKKFLEDGDVILIKGSRSMRMEAVLEGL